MIPKDITNNKKEWLLTLSDLLNENISLIFNLIIKFVGEQYNISTYTSNIELQTDRNFIYGRISSLDFYIDLKKKKVIDPFFFRRTIKEKGLEYIKTIQNIITRNINILRNYIMVLKTVGNRKNFIETQNPERFFIDKILGAYGYIGTQRKLDPDTMASILEENFWRARIVRRKSGYLYEEKLAYYFMIEKENKLFVVGYKPSNPFGYKVCLKKIDS